MHSSSLEKKFRFSIIFAVLTVVAIIWVVLFVQGRALRRVASQEIFGTVEMSLRTEFSSIATPIEQQLRQLEEWGSAGLFRDNDPVEFSGFLLPILRNLDVASGLIMANSSGEQLHLYRIGDSIVVDTLAQTLGQSSELSTFIPSDNSWYNRATDPEKMGAVVWTEPYIFEAQRQSGVTAAIAWHSAQTDETTVIAFDVLLTSISELVQSTTIGNGGHVFVVNRYFDVLAIDDTSSLPQAVERKTLFTDWTQLENPILIELLNRDFREEQEVDPGLYYVNTSEGKYWVKSVRVHSLLPEYAIVIIAPEKGLNKQIEKQTMVLNLISAIIVIIGGLLLAFILYHTLYTFRLIQNTGELNHIFSKSSDIETFLDNTVQTIAKFLSVPVCSIYLFDEEQNKIVLKGTHGLNKELIDVTALEYGEGLVGLTLKEMRPIRAAGASNQQHFQPVEGLNEEKYDSFLAVPITRGLHKIGVLVIQKRLKRNFSNRTIQTMEIVSSQLTSVMETAGYLLTFINGSDSSSVQQTEIKTILSIKGKMASPGYAFGSVSIDHKRDIFSYLKKMSWKENHTLKDFDRAIDQTTAELEQLQLSVEERLEDSAAMIFMAHLLMLKDASYAGEIRKHIGNGISPSDAILHVAEELIRSFATSTSRVLQEKVDDIKDLTIQLLSHLSPDLNEQQAHSDRIVISRELLPSDILVMASEGTKGIILVSGGATSHLAILCRSLQIPLLLTTDADILSISPDCEILLDTNHGVAYINPSDDQIKEYRPLIASNIAAPRLINKQTTTSDGVEITLHANVNLITDISQAKSLNIGGIGLYRSEFPFMIRDSFPTEMEQFNIYKKVADHVSHKELTFRTLDIGGDKTLSYIEGVKEENPFLGLRAIRFSLKEKTLFVNQLKAVLRAAVHNELRIMFPMIQSVDEFLEAKMILKETIEELQSNGIICHPTPKVGIMVELPAAVTLIERFAKVCDFFSIGTNDLIQYLLGVDRTNAEVAPLYVGHHPAVLSAIARVAEVALANDCDLSVCGDMASSDRHIPFLIGCGVKKLSVDPVYMPRVQEVIGKIDSAKAKEFAQELLKCDTISECKAIIDTF